MKYIHWGGNSENPLVSRLGFGTTRFNQKDLVTEEGIRKCVNLVEYALEKGINYFDVAPTYSNGMAEKILGMAFYNQKEPVYVSAKTGLMIDKTNDDVRRRIENSLNMLHKDTIDFYHIWSVLDWNQYTEVSKPGGILEGVLRAKQEGIIKHVCISLHCDPETTLKILDDGIFEGITISLNALNYRKWAKVLERTVQCRIAVATMNSLAGGMIPLYANLFEDIDKSSDSVPQKALRFVLQLPGVNVALSGMPTKKIIDENCLAVDHLNDVVSNRDFIIPVKENLCSGCDYCRPCTVGIPISACMQAYNHKILVESSTSGNCIELDKIANDVFTRVRANGVVFPELKQCVACHMCEKRCTQKIRISERMMWLSSISKTFGYNNLTMKARLQEVERKCKNSEKVAIWPAADYASRVLDWWGNTSFENKCIFINSSPAMWGARFRNSTIMSPQIITEEKIKTIVIMHHRLQKEIFIDLRDRYPNLQIICLHKDSDIDWFNRMI